jgi:hypothetical protein
MFSFCFPELERKMRPSLEAGYSYHPYSPNAEWVKLEII